MEKHLDNQNLVAEFVSYAEKKGVKLVPTQLELSRNIISTRLKAFISRNILGDEGFYPILFKNDPAVLRAIQELK